jgi:mannobiose 2-epimerase
MKDGKNEVKASYTQANHWREHGLKDIMKPWFIHMKDTENGNFHMKFDMDWQPLDRQGKHPWIISRQVFALSAGYLLYGEDSFLNSAEAAVDWLLQYAWDLEHGGWLDLLTEDGQPIRTNKKQFNNLYVDTGLALYFFVTRDQRVLEKLEASAELRDCYWWDAKHEGYYKELNRDHSVKDDTKDFGGQFVPLSGPWIYLYLATGDDKYLQRMERIFGKVLPHMVDDKLGWILENFDREWAYRPEEVGELEVDLGHNIETAWILLRGYHLTGKSSWLEQGKKLADLSLQHGYDPESSMWPWKIARSFHQEQPTWTHWWVQMYGNFITIYMYHLTGDKKYLQAFEKTADFWFNHFIDPVRGGDYLQVDRSADNEYTGKNRPESAYHSSEHFLFMSLYLDLFVQGQSAEVYFRFLKTAEGEKHRVSPIEDPQVHVTAAETEGKALELDPAQRAIICPKAERMKVKAVLNYINHTRK